MSIHFRAALIGLVLAAAGLYWPCIAGVPFYTKGEPREAIVVQQMLATGDPVLPLLTRGEIQSKPPLFHWLGSLASLAAGGISETSVRTPSLVASLATIVATALMGLRMGVPTGGLAAAVILASSPQWIQASTSARVDMVLASAVTFALFEFLLAYLAGRAVSLRAYGWSAAAVLAKGPIGLALPVVVVATFLAVRRDPAYARSLRLGPGALVLCVPLIWYLPAWLEAGRPFLDKVILDENLLRVLDPVAAGAGHAKPAYFYLPALFAGLAPWSVLLPAAVCAALRSRRDAAGPVFLLIWVLMTFAVFSLSGSKRGVYLLPSYPALALLIGTWLAPWLDRARSPAPSTGGAMNQRLLPVLAAVLSIVPAASLLVLWIPALQEWVGSLLNPKDATNLDTLAQFARSNAIRTLLWLAGTWALTGVLAHSVRRRRWDRAFAAPALMVALMLGTMGGPGIRYLAERATLREFMASVRHEVPPGEPLSFYRQLQYLEHFRPAAVYYAGRAIPVVETLAPAGGEKRVWLIAGLSSLPGGLTESTDGGDGYEWRAVATRSFGPEREPLVLVTAVHATNDEHVDGTNDREAEPDHAARRAQ